jgi:hypothetical protein
LEIDETSPQTKRIRKLVIPVEVDKILDWIIEIYVKHKCSWELILDILRLVNKILQEKLLPETKYMLFKMISTNVSPIFHLICCKCGKVAHELDLECSKREKSFICDNFIGDQSETKCGTKNDISSSKVAFATFPIEKMLKEVLEKYSDCLLFPEPHVGVGDYSIEDTWDAEIHQEVLKKEGRFISLFFNTDGVQFFDSASQSFWPLMILINNLPIHIRFKLENVLCIGFFYGKSVGMDVFLKNFITTLRDFNKNGGIEISTGTFKTFCLGSSLDSAAKPKLINIKQYNGYNSCPYCEIEGMRICGAVKFPFR